MASVLTTRRNPDGSLTFAVEGHGELTLHPDRLSAAVQIEARANGLTQTMVDSAALPRNEDGSPASPAAKWAAIKARYETITSGYWTMGGAIYQAIAAVTGKSYAESRAWYDGLSKDKQDALRRTKRVQDALAAIRGQATSDVGDRLLDEISTQS